MNIIAPNPTNSIVNAAGRMSQAFWSWTQEITRGQVAIGSGSPEGVLEAPVSKQYMDTTGTAGNILYVKRDAAIGGDAKQGWILV